MDDNLPETLEVILTDMGRAYVAKAVNYPYDSTVAKLEYFVIVDQGCLIEDHELMTINDKIVFEQYALRQEDIISRAFLPLSKVVIHYARVNNPVQDE